MTITFFRKDAWLTIFLWLWISGDSIASPGALDRSFRLDPAISSGEIYCIVLQPDGKILIGGDLYYYKTIGARQYQITGLTRLNPDGSLDPDFAPGSGLPEVGQGLAYSIDGEVYAIAVDSFGSILAGGTLEKVGGIPCSGLVRLNPDGSCDAGLLPVFAGDDHPVEIRSIIVQPDGKILVGGYFTSVGGVISRDIARFNPDGTRDSAFQPNPGVEGEVYCMALQSDGKVLVGGEFSKVNNQSRHNLTRLNSNGSLDTSFDPDLMFYGPPPTIHHIIIQRDKKILIGGQFQAINTLQEPHDGLARLNSNGSVDTQFGSEKLITFIDDRPWSISMMKVRTFVQQSNSQIVVGGGFHGIQNLLDLEESHILWRNDVAGFNAIGSIDSGFNPGAGVGSDPSSLPHFIQAMALQSDGKILIGGRFDSYDLVPRENLARIEGDLTVVVLDTLKPTVTINTPANKARVTNPAVAFGGTASDNVAVSQVWCRLNNDDWQEAQGTTEWSLSLTLGAGTNSLSVFAVDTSNNRSKTNSISIVWNGGTSISPYAGYYVGQGNLGNIAQFQFGFMVSDQGVASGVIFEKQKKGATFMEFSVAEDGSFQTSVWGATIFGRVTAKGAVTATTQDVHGTGRFQGSRMPFTGIFLAESGLYQGTYSYGGYEGVFSAVFCPDGTLYYWYDAGAGDRAQIADSNGRFSLTVPTGHQVDGNLNRDTFTIQGQSISGFGIILIRVYGVAVPGNAPTITQQPKTQPVVSGGNITLKVTARSSLPLSYQWFVNGTPLADGVLASLTLRKVKFEQAGFYEVEVTNMKGSVRSDPVPLVVLPETIKPTVAISSPVNKARVFEPQVLLKGTAADNVDVIQVNYQYNEYPWQMALGTTQWISALALQPGSNVVQVQAVDSSTNFSTIKPWTLVYVSTDPVELTVEGNGMVEGVTNRQWLEVGMPHEVTAIPAGDSLFKSWLINGVSREENPLIFIMLSNLTVQAQFAPNPFLKAKGVYSGLFYPTNQDSSVQATNSGFLTLKMTDKGQASGKLMFAGQTISLSQLKFNPEGVAQITVNRKAPSPPLEAVLHLEEDGAIRGEITQGKESSAVTAFLGQPWTNWIGSYTFVVAGGNIEDTNSPAGAGIGTAIVSKKGDVKWTATLADGIKYTASSLLLGSGWTPLYVSLQSGRGMVIGWIQFTFDGSLASLAGDLVWSKGPALTKNDLYYREGFVVQRHLEGAIYQAPLKGQSIMSWPQGNIEFSGGDLPHPVIIPVEWMNNKLMVIGPNTTKLAVTLTTSSGLFSGSFVPPETTRAQKFSGVLLPSAGLGTGWFLSPTLSGLVELGPGVQP